MVQGDFLFDKKRDLQDVDQMGYVNLHDAVKNGVIPSNLSFDESSYNDIEDPRSILGKPRDKFEAMQMAHVVAERGKADPNTPPS